MSLLENFDCHGCSGDMLCEDHFSEVCIQSTINKPVVTSSTYRDSSDDQHPFWEPAIIDKR